MQADHLGPAGQFFHEALCGFFSPPCEVTVKAFGRGWGRKPWVSFDVSFPWDDRPRPWFSLWLPLVGGAVEDTAENVKRFWTFLASLNGYAEYVVHAHGVPIGQLPWFFR